MERRQSPASWTGTHSLDESHISPSFSMRWLLHLSCVFWCALNFALLQCRGSPPLPPALPQSAALRPPPEGAPLPEPVFTLDDEEEGEEAGDFGEAGEAQQPPGAAVAAAAAPGESAAGTSAEAAPLAEEDEAAAAVKRLVEVPLRCWRCRYIAVDFMSWFRSRVGLARLACHHKSVNHHTPAGSCTAVCRHRPHCAVPYRKPLSSAPAGCISAAPGRGCGGDSGAPAGSAAARRGPAHTGASGNAAFLSSHGT